MTNKTAARRWSVEKRLEFIDFRLYWEGQINRADIMERFSVSVPQASKDLSLYQESAPENLEYDHRVKKYFAAPTFKPAFMNPDADTYFWQMRDDVRPFLTDDLWLSSLLPHDVLCLPRRNVHPQILRDVIAVLHAKKAIKIFYQSMSSEEAAWRIISPHAFAFDGQRWHVRAFCHNGGYYKDFLLSRIQETELTQEAAISGDKDNVWNEFFTLSLKPHPQLTESQAKAVALDYEMNDMKLDIKIRLALLYYYLRRLGLEDKDGTNKNPKEQHVVVSNKEETIAAMKRAQQISLKETAVS